MPVWPKISTRVDQPPRLVLQPHILCLPLFTICLIAIVEQSDASLQRGEVKSR
jgi:hypothetical protein